MACFFKACPGQCVATGKYIAAGYGNFAVDKGGANAPYYIGTGAGFLVKRACLFNIYYILAGIAQSGKFYKSAVVFRKAFLFHYSSQKV